MDDLVEESLHKAALWDEVKDKLKESGLALSGGQQQRLCIARAIATKPDVILMDEPCSALDPIATAKIEDLMQELVADYTIVIVTHNMQQAARVSDRTAFFTVEVHDDGSPDRDGGGVRPHRDRSSRTPAISEPRTTSRGGSDEPRDRSTSRWSGSRWSLLSMGELASNSVQRCRRRARATRRRQGARRDRRRRS